MKQIGLLFISIFIICGSVFAQSSSYEELIRYIEKQNTVLPCTGQIGEYKFTMVKANIDGKYFRYSADIYDKSLYNTLSSQYRFAIKDNIIKTLKADSESLYLIKLLLACDLELKYVYTYKKKEVVYLIDKDELKKMLK